MNFGIDVVNIIGNKKYLGNLTFPHFLTHPKKKNVKNLEKNIQRNQLQCYGISIPDIEKL
jgi:hypothetical protein